MNYKIVGINDNKDYDAKFFTIYEEDINDGKIEYELLNEINGLSSGLVQKLIKKEKLKGKSGNFTSFYVEDTRYTIVGLGKKEKIDTRNFKTAMGKIFKNSVSEKDKTVLINLRDENPEYFSIISEACEVSAYTFSEYLNDKKKKELKVHLENVDITGENNKENQKSIEKGKIIGIARNFARDLINHPSNYMTPKILAKTIEKRLKKAEVEIFDKKKIKELKMGGLLGVNQGAKEDPRFIIMRHSSKKNKKNVKLVLVGKGVTFDSGGISLKPSQNMHEMKGDMAGAATVAALMEVISELNLPVEIIGLIPSTPNMPGGNAINPGDILTALNGKTVEVLNTDAEGRLILMDALSYAVKHEKATHIVDFATLTGAMVVALGDIATGIFANNDEIANGIINASEKAGEYVWRFPIFNEYSKQLESKIADLKNIGGRKAGSITAAKFLEEFVDNTPWAHLDIAGTFWQDKHDYLYPNGTGEIVSTISNWLIEFAQ